MSDLLPHNASAFEQDLEEVTSRISDVAVPVRDMWDWETCPVEVLPWLAWAFSVDQWQSNWDEEQQRAVVRDAIAVQKLKGTFGAVRAALAGIDIDAQVLEWHRSEVPGQPYTFRLLIDASSNAATMEGILQAIEIVDRMKSLRSHVSGVEVGTSARAGPYVAAVASVGSEIQVGYQGRYLALTGIWDDAAQWSDISAWGLEI